MQRAFEVKQKTFFIVSQVLSFRYAKQTRKNVVDTTFKITNWFCKIPGYNFKFYDKTEKLNKVEESLFISKKLKKNIFIGKI